MASAVTFDDFCVPCASSPSLAAGAAAANRDAALRKLEVELGGMGDARFAAPRAVKQRAVKRDSPGGPFGVVVNPLARVSQRAAPEASVEPARGVGARARAKEIALGAPNRRFMQAMWRNR